MDDNELEFQIIDIGSDDVPIGDDYWNKEFTMTFYGKTSDNRDVVCNVIGFKPYFYLRVPRSWGRTYTNKFLENVTRFINSKNSRNKWDGIYEKSLLEVNKYKNFYGFNYDTECKKIREYRFAKISFSTYGGLRKCVASIIDFYKYNVEHTKDGKICYMIKKDGNPRIEGGVEKKLIDWFRQEHNCNCLCNLYESKVHPLLRFIHEKNIESCGWVSISCKRDKWVNEDEKVFNVDIEINNLHMRNIRPIKKDSIAGFVTASFDIECDSSHGDFPNPEKDFRKLAIDIYESYFRTSQNHNEMSMKRIFIEKCIRDAFNGGSDDVQSVFTLNGEITTLSLLEVMESIDEDLIEMMDVSKETNKKRENVINNFTDILNNIKNERGEVIKIKGDPIIQIGTVFHRYGDKECYNRSIIVIGNDSKPDEKICDDIEGVDVFECQSEKELLLKGKDLILYHNPDMITGYNIFGFDFDYINKRVDYLFKCTSRCKKTKTYSNCSYDCSKNDFYRLGRLMRNRESDRVTSLEGISKTSKSQRYYNNFWEKKCQVMSKNLSSSGLGDNILKYISMDGRIVFDIQKEIQKGHSLESYKLDDVSAHFMKGDIIDTMIYSTINNMGEKRTFTNIVTKTVGNLKKNDYITVNINTKYGSFRYMDGMKFKVINLGVGEHGPRIWADTNHISNIKKKYSDELISYEWCLAKDDISPQDIFKKHKDGGSQGRADVAKYCIMDCELCIHILLQLDLIPNNIGMATVSWVPLSYIFLRGQGVKINSIITKECSERGTRIPTLCGYMEGKEDDGFEGAIVLEPKPGIYLDDPICVLDYASLYPSSIIEKNLSHETYIGTEEEIKNNPSKEKIIQSLGGYDACWGIEYDDYVSELKGKTFHKSKVGTKTKCYFVKRTEKSQGIIPIVLQTLLDQRKATRARIRDTNDDNKKKVLDGLQLAYKITANSVYGQMGAKTSPIFFKKIAACTTAIGRERIDDASDGVKLWAKEKGYYEPDIIYGDTDSVFIKFSRRNKDGILLEGKEALKYCIECGVESGKWITKNMLNHPQDLEYEKTFYPFILISKKRYTGDKYEIDTTKPKERTSMGIVMKRRDNAPIVKYVFGNVVEIIMNKRSIDLSMEWLKDTLTRIKNGEMNESLFTISKSLRGYYKNPEGIAHKVLADRMAERNPGNKPKPNDRIPYMYRVVDESPIITGYKMVKKKIDDGKYKNGKPKTRTITVQGEPKVKKRNILQGDRIEHPDYIREKKLKIDYNFYISNQIMNPIKQVLDLEKNEEDTKIFFDQFIK